MSGKKKNKEKVENLKKNKSLTTETVDTILGKKRDGTATNKSKYIMRRSSAER
jgi:hypothetical protein